MIGARRSSRALLGALAASAALHAQPAAAEPPAPGRRRVGFGSAHGPTVGGATLFTMPRRVGAGTGAALVGLTLPTFEVQLFAPQLYSVDLSTSLTGTLLAAGFEEVFYLTQDAYLTFHLGRGVARFVGGPGLGFSAAFREDDRGVQNGASLRLSSQVGVELLTKNEAFGVSFLGRPWLEVSHVQGSGEQRTFVGGGFAQHIAFFGYFRQ